VEARKLELNFRDQPTARFNFRAVFHDRVVVVYRGIETACGDVY
jgi:hypothetical protein